MASFVDYGVLGRRGVPLGSCGAWRGLVGGCCSSAAKALQCVYDVPAACCLLPADDL